MTPDQDLMDAVAAHEVSSVERLLAGGADPNLRVDADDLAQWQPTTPLRMVAFRISDSLLDEDDLADFAAIAGLLLRHGADPEPARQLAELRYGPFDPAAEDSAFQRVWAVIATTPA